MKISGIFACLVFSGCVFASAQQQQPPAKSNKQVAAEPPQAFITSSKVVYRAGEPVDLTFAVAMPKSGKIMPNFRIESKSKEAVEPQKVRGKYIWESQGKTIDGKPRNGAILPSETDDHSPAHQHTETIDNLRDWYELDALGMYTIRFDGDWVDEKRESHGVSSNSIIVQLVGPGGETEPGGEPIQSREIPLADIWALNMPGTKPMKTSISTGGFVAPEGNLVAEIRREALQGSKNLLVAARRGFIVRRTGMEALREAHSVLVGQNEPDSLFHRGDEVTLVFFSKSSGRYVHLDRAVDHGSVIEVSYKLVQHMTTEATSHLALIPLKLDHLGIVRVQIGAITPKEPLKVDMAEYVLRTISQSFEFQVVE